MLMLLLLQDPRTEATPRLLVDAEYQSELRGVEDLSPLLEMVQGGGGNQGQREREVEDERWRRTRNEQE